MKKLLGLFLMFIFVVGCSSKQVELSNYAKGIEATKSKQYEQAINFFNKTVDEETNVEIKASALYNIGFCYGIMKNYEKEIEYYKKSVDVFPDFQAGLYDLGKYYYDNNNFESASKMFSHLVEVNDIHEGAYYMLALAQLELKKNEEAMANMKKAAELDSPEAKQFLEQQDKNSI